MGRHCHNHECCDSFVEFGSILHVHCAPAWRWGKLWNDLEVYMVFEGVDTCKVGYLAKEFVEEADALDLDSKNTNQGFGYLYCSHIPTHRIKVPAVS